MICFFCFLFSDISKLKADDPTQPVLKVFPKTMQGGARRSFHGQWYEEYPWLEYSVAMDAAYCFACRHFSSSKTVYTSSVGYKNWRKATFKDGGFSVHSKSEAHLNAMTTWRDHQKMMKRNTSVLGMMNDENRKQIKENQQYIKTIGQVLRLTAIQNIAQRGHNENDESRNRGNFLEILQVVGDHDSFIQKRLSEGPRNAMYTSKNIQNEILQILAGMVQEDILKEVKSSQYFSVTSDETKDLSKREQLSIVLRYYYEGAVREGFLGFWEAEHLDASSLANKIISSLEQYGLEYKENLVGQGYDGAAVMSGRCSGVQTRVKQVAKYAFYVHCNAHCLNLVIVDCVKKVPEAGEFFTLLQQLYVFLSGSYVHQKWMEVQAEMFSGPPRELQSLSDTRWACRGIACKNLFDRLPAVLKVLDDISYEVDPERSTKARGLMSQIDLNFIGLLAIFRQVLGDAKFLSELLQSPNLDLLSAVDLIETLRETFEEHRNEDEYFDELWNTVIHTCETCNIPITVRLKRAKQTPRALNDSYVTSTLGHRSQVNGKDAFRTNIFLPIMDSIIGEMQKRFSTSSCNIMKGLQGLNPISNHFLKEDIVLLLAEAYGSNIEDLKNELAQVERLFARSKRDGKNCPSSLIELLGYLDPFKEVFYEMHRLCKIAAVLPVTTAGCERSFSTLKLVKNHLRSTMLTERLSHLAVLSIESDRAKAIDLNEFVQRFASIHGNRRLQLI